MPRTDQVICVIDMQCDYCGEHVKLDERSSTEEVQQILPNWKGIMSADNPPQQGNDTHRWYDTFECMVAGEQKYDSEVEKRAEQAKQLARANEAMKKIPGLDRALKLAKA